MATTVAGIFDGEYGLPMTSGMQDLVTTHNVLPVLMLPVTTLMTLKSLGTSLVRTEDSILIEYGVGIDPQISFHEVFFDDNAFWPEELLRTLRLLANSYVFELTRYVHQRPV